MTSTQTPSRPRLKHAMTVTAFAWIQTRNAWREWFRGVVAERREMSQRQRGGS